MSISKQTLAQIRYGYGFRPGEDGPRDAKALLAQLKREDPFVKNARIATLEQRFDWLGTQAVARKARRQNKAGADALVAKVDKAYMAIATKDIRWHFIRPITSQHGFRERLVAFWTDHFTVAATNRRLTLLTPDMIQTAIRPHVGGNFGDMLKAVTMHPAMLVFLNQSASIGPNSPAGKGAERGLNENLAREILELHTLGVGAEYSQNDVRQFAELLTGLTVDKEGFVFRARRAEPGAETVLGKDYGGRRGKVGDILKALDDLALRRDTARHLARKLITHFIGGKPAPDHVKQIIKAYRSSDGNLQEAYRAMLDHPNAWEPKLQKAKTPFDFEVSAFRAMGVTRADITNAKQREINRTMLAPLRAMGQPLLRPNGPDGWSESPADWITPAGLAARIKWANALAQREAREKDPVLFLETTLHDAASPLLKRAVAGSETRHEGVALVLSSPEFNRR